MEGYLPDGGYQTKSAFFAQHLRAHPRLLAYDRYLHTRLQRGEKVLSVASGRCANELYLMFALDCDITCSDLREPPCIPATKSLFPSLKFIALDVMRDDPPDTYDTVLSLGLIYAFDDRQLDQFFSFVWRALRPKGRLLLDSAGSPDNFLSYLLHDLFLPTEAALLSAVRTIRHLHLHRVQGTPHGYRRTLEDIEKSAAKAGFFVKDVHEDGFDIDLRRGIVLNRLGTTRMGTEILTRIGRHMPYTRMMQLVRADDVDPNVAPDRQQPGLS